MASFIESCAHYGTAEGAWVRKYLMRYFILSSFILFLFFIFTDLLERLKPAGIYE